MKVYNSTKNSLIEDSINVADNIVSRTIGLLSKSDLKNGEGIVIKPCCSIHTFFMKFAIDVIFIKKCGEVVATYSNVKPFRILPIHPSSYYVLELKAGEIIEKNIEKHDMINFD